MLSLEEKEYYLQQLKLPEVGEPGQNQLKQASVLCVGAGGLGSPLLYYLAAAGVGQIDILDEDIVENSNLQRQILYKYEDIGRKKCQVAKQQLEALNPYITVNAIEERLQASNAKELIKKYDIIADCSDNFSTRYLVNDTCFALNKPFVFASILRFQGECAFFSGRQSPCFRCLFPYASERIADCREGGVLGVLPGLLGVMQASQILQFLLQPSYIPQHLLTVDILTMQFKKFELASDPHCELCSGKLKNNFNNDEINSIISITYAELQEKSKNKENFILLDVRSQNEHQAVNIGGIHIPLSELEVRSVELDPNQLVIIYCQSGMRSIEAAKLLAKNNFKSVGHLKEGISGCFFT